jgi:hypothetical protein
LKSYGKTFWRVLIFGIILDLIEGLFIKDIKDSIGFNATLIIFILTITIGIYGPLYLGWREGQVEILS